MHLSHPVAPRTAEMSSSRSSSGGVSAGVNRSEHPSPRRSDTTTRPN